MFQRLQSLRKRWKRPDVGAGAALSSLQPKAAGSQWAGQIFEPRWAHWIFSKASWLMILAVAFISFLPWTDKSKLEVEGIKILLGLYLLYVLFLEFSSRFLPEYYDTPVFRAVRIGVNVVAVSALVSFEGSDSRYFWFFYSLPALQAAIYFGDSGLALVDVVSVAAYWVVSLASNPPDSPVDLTLLCLNSAILLFISYLLYWLLRSAQEQRNLAQLNALLQISQNVVAKLTLEGILQTSLTQTLQAIRTDEGSIMLVDPATDELETKAWLVQGEFVPDKRHPRFKLGEGVAGHVVAMGKAHNCPDTSKDPLFVGSPTDRKIRSLLCVPIVSHGRVLGAINTDSQQLSFFKEGDIQFLSAVASHVASAIESYRLREIGATLSTFNLDVLLTKIVESACLLTGAEFSTLFLVDEDSGKLVRARNFPPSRQTTGRPRPDGLTQHIMATGEPVVIPRAQPDPRVKLASKDQGIQSIMGVPLRIGRGHGGGEGESGSGTLGVLWVNTRHARNFDDRDCELLQILANQAAIAIENAQLYRQVAEQRDALTWKTQQLMALHAASLQLTSAQGIPDLIKAILERAVDLLKAVGGGLYIRDRSTGRLRLAAVHHLPESLLGTLVPLELGIVDQVARTNTPASISDYRRWSLRLPLYDDFNFTAVAAAPISQGEMVWGVIAVHSDEEGRVYDQEDLYELSLLCTFAAVVLKNAEWADGQERLMRSSIDAIIAIDESGKVVKYNAQAERILGYTSAEVLETAVSRLYAETSEAATVKRMLLESTEGQIADYDTYVRSKRGERIPIRLSASLLYDTEGQRAGSVGFFRDQREIRSAHRQINQLKSLLVAGRSITELHGLQTALKTIADQAVEALDADVVNLYLYDHERDEIIVPPVRRGLRKQEEASLDVEPDSIVRKIIYYGQEYFTANAPEDPLMRGDFTTREAIQSCAAGLLRAGDRIVGVMFCSYREAHSFSEQERAMFRLFADVAAIAVQNARLYESTRHQVQRLGLLLEASQRISSFRPIQEQLHDDIEEFRLAAGYDVVILYSYDPNRQEFDAPLVSGKLNYEIAVGPVKSDVIAWKLIQEGPDSHFTSHSTGDALLAGPFVRREGIRASGYARLIVDGQVVGLLFVNTRSAHDFNTEERRSVCQFADQVAQKIQKASVLRAIVDSLQQAMGFDVVTLYLYDATENKLSRPLVSGQLRTPPGSMPLQPDSRVWNALRGDASHFANTALTDSVRFADAAPHESVEASGYVRLEVRGQPVGIIFVTGRREHQWTESEKREVRLFANQAAIAIHNMQQYKALDKNRQQLNALHEAGNTIAKAGLDIDAVLQAILEQAVSVTGASFGTLQRVENDGLEFLAAWPATRLDWLKENVGRMPIEGRGITARAARENHAQLVPNVSVDPDFVDVTGKTGSEVAVVLWRHGKPIGVLNVEHPSVLGLDNDDRDLLIGLANLAVVAIENAERANQLESVAWTTALGVWGAEIAHDVNREAGAIRRLLYILRQSAGLPDEVKERLRQADQYAAALVLPTESGQSAQTDLSAEIDESVAWANDRWPSLSWRCEVPPQPLRVRINSWWLSRLIRHLLRNSADAMPVDRPRREVIIRARAEDTTAVLEIEDTGPGLSREVEPLVFRQLIKRDEQIGSGLLLVGSTIARYNGSARVLWNRPGQGVCFELRLPLAV